MNRSVSAVAPTQGDAGRVTLVLGSRVVNSRPLDWEARSPPLR